MSIAIHHDDPISYPESDGQPMADNTLQFRWIVMLKENLDAVLSDFVAGDLLWYPVEGRPDVRVAPDVLVALGRPKGDRGSYRQWDEDHVAPAAVFEVLSPGNTVREMFAKLGFYDRHGVDEFYVLDPDVEVLEAFVRREGGLREVLFERSFTSPRLGIRFERHDEHLTVFRPDGRPFRTVAELFAERDQVAAERDAASAERDAVVAERDAISAERDAVAVEAARLAQRLREMGVDPDER